MTFTVPPTIAEAQQFKEKLDYEMHRLKRIWFDNAYAMVSRQPGGYRRDVMEVGLYFRWQRNNAMWALDSGMSMEQVAEMMGASVQMVQDYLGAPKGTDEEYFAKIAAWCGEEG